MGFGNLGIASAMKTAEAARKAAAAAAKAAKAGKAASKVGKTRNWKKILQAGALVAEAGSRGSAGNIASKLGEADIDLSGMNPFGRKNKFKKDPATEANENY